MRRPRPLKALSQMIFRTGMSRLWFLPRSRYDFEKEVGDGTGSSTVMAPLLWIMRTFTEAPPMLWKLLDGGQEEEQPTHVLLKLLRRPNTFYSGHSLWKATLADYFVTGDGYWIKLRNRAGKGVPAELWWAPSWTLEPKGDGRTFITHYEYDPGSGDRVRLEVEDVVHFRYGLDPNDPKHGLSPLRSVLREVFTDDEAANFTASLLRNMGVPGVLVAPDPAAPAPSADDVKAVKAYVSNQYTGDQRGKPLVLSGATKVQTFGFNPQEMDLKTLRRIPEERVSAVLGVPAIVAGLGAGLDRSTFANYSEAREAGWEENIIPTQRSMAEDVTWQLLADFESDPMTWRFGFDLSNVRVLQEDLNKLAERLRTGVAAGCVKRAEYRRAFGFETDDSDEVYLLPISVVEVAPGEQVGNEPAALDGETPPKRSRRRGAKASEANRRLLSLLSASADRLASVFAEELESDLDGLGRLAEEGALSVPGLSSRYLNGATKQSDDAVVESILQWIAVENWQAEKFTPRYKAHYLRTLERTVEDVNSVLSLGIMLPDPVQVEIAARGGRRAGLVDLPEQTKAALYAGLAEGREQGLAREALARTIRKHVTAGRFVGMEADRPGAGVNYRAKLIARTETKFAQNVATIAAYRQSEAVEGVLAFDNRTGFNDPDCVARDGKVFTFEEAEAETEAEHPNGTLSWAPATRELTTGARR